jgi:hypothetical protein
MNTRAKGTTTAAYAAVTLQKAMRSMRELLSRIAQMRSSAGTVVVKKAAVRALHSRGCNEI